MEKSKDLKGVTFHMSEVSLGYLFISHLKNTFHVYPV